MSDTPEIIGQDIQGWLLTDTGKRYIDALDFKYRELHRKAEDDTISLERKGMMIERAAGVKWCIEWLTQRSVNFESGYYTKK